MFLRSLRALLAQIGIIKDRLAIFGFSLYFDFHKKLQSSNLLDESDHS